MQDLSWLAGLGAATQLGGQGIEAHQALRRALEGDAEQKKRQAAADRLAKLRTVAELMGQGATMPDATVAPPSGLPSTGTPNLVSPPDYADDSKLDLSGIGTRQALHNAVLQAQATKEQALAGRENQQTLDLGQRSQANRRAFGTLSKLAPQHPLVANGFDPNADYLGELKAATEGQAKSRQQLLDQRRNYNTLRAEFPQHALARQPFDEANPADYAAAISDAREQRKQAIQVNTGDWTSAGVNKDGDPVIVNKRTGETRVGGGLKTPNGLQGSQQTQQARLLAAVSEARLADERMRAFEDRLLAPSGDTALRPTTISPLKQAAGSLVTNLADSHGVLGALTQAGSEYALNKNDPEYAQYLRDASTIGRAEQMMSPRGGNETMVRANALLSRAGSGAMKNTIDASRMARQALFGQSGGVAQSLNPAQNQKLQSGLDAIRGGDHATSTGKQSITQAEYRQLKGMGYTDAQLAAKYTVSR